jgi:DNA polymerase-3 subunit beta
MVRFFSFKEELPIMKIICEKDLLVEAVSNVARAACAKSPVPALEGILLKAQDGQLQLTGYDLELGIVTTIEAKTEQPGQLILSARLLLDIIRRIPAQTVSILSDERDLATIRGGASEFTIPGLNAEEYPELPNFEQQSDLVLKQGVLKSMIDQTLFAIATTDSKPVHTGSLFDVKDSCVTLVSVDGYRLALRREPIVSDLTTRFIVPGKTLAEISKLLKEEDEEAYLALSQKHIVFRIGGYYVVSRLLEGEFLDYNAAIPKVSKTTVKINTRSLTDAVERTSLLISDRLRSPIRLSAMDQKVQLNCSTSMGKAHDEVDCEMSGEAVSMGFNNKYLMDALKASDCDMVKLEINGALSPMRILPLEGESFLFLVLPVRVKNDD